MDIADPDAIHVARRHLRRHLATCLREAFFDAYQRLTTDAAYVPDGAQAGARALRNQCLSYLFELAPQDADALALLQAQFEGADNMTDSMAALSALANLAHTAGAAALDTFYERWKDEPLVIDKWFGVQATSRLPDTVARVRALLKHPGFDIRNPNKVYSLVRGFCAANLKYFHSADGSGYALAADVILEIDAINPQVASRIARCFDRWRRVDTARQALARRQLERVLGRDGLSADVQEVVGRALEA
jgi:aminopeptidase N